MKYFLKYLSRAFPKLDSIIYIFLLFNWKKKDGTFPFSKAESPDSKNQSLQKHFDLPSSDQNLLLKLNVARPDTLWHHNSSTMGHCVICNAYYDITVPIVCMLNKERRQEVNGLLIKRLQKTIWWVQKSIKDFQVD